MFSTLLKKYTSKRGLLRIFICFRLFLQERRGNNPPMNLADGLVWLWTGISRPDVKVGLQKLSRCYILDRHFYFFTYPNISTNSNFLNHMILFPLKVLIHTYFSLYYLPFHMANCKTLEAMMHLYRILQLLTKTHLALIYFSLRPQMLIKQTAFL